MSVDKVEGDAVTERWRVSDGVIVIRPPQAGEADVLIAGRDAEWERWLGPGAERPQPAACVLIVDRLVGWVDYDMDRDWLEPGEVNIGYHVFATHRGQGYASRAVKLLLHRLALEGGHRRGTLLIHPDNVASLAVARRTGFTARGELAGCRYFARPVPSLSYTDGTVTIRRQHAADLEADLGAKDDEQIDWMWVPGQRQTWEAMTLAEQRAHALRGLQANYDSFGAGPKWTFAVDADSTPYVAYVDADLANPVAPAGEANISYSCHPDYRGKGYVTRAVQLIQRFLTDHTAARRAHLVIDQSNRASLRVACSVGAAVCERFVNQHGRVMIRHVLDIPALG
jgi:RimJ/RimL family protein N-acetyltransferase